MYPGNQNYNNNQYGGYNNGGSYQPPQGPPPPEFQERGFGDSSYGGGYQPPQGPPPSGDDYYSGDRSYNGGGYNEDRSYNGGYNEDRSYNGGGYQSGSYGAPPPQGFPGQGYAPNDSRGGFPGQGYAPNDGYGGPPPQQNFPGDGYSTRGHGGGGPPAFPGSGGYSDGPGSSYSQAPSHRGSDGYGGPPQSGNSYGGPPPPGNNYGPPGRTNSYGGPPGGMPAPPGGYDFGVAPPMNMPVVTHRPEEIDYGGMDFPEWHQPAYTSPPPQQQYQQQQQQQQQQQPSHGSIPQYNIPQELQQQAGKVQLSNCAGRKRALLIGINYIGTKYKLRGCINDVHNIKKFIMEHFGYKESDMVILTDDQTSNPSRMPTHQNIIKAMKWLVSNAKMNDSFFFHYSGHGSTVPCKSGEELDGNDETICPVDFVKNGQIIDDDMNAIMVRPLPPGARLTAIYDCCHSASALDLPFMYNHMGKLKNEKAITYAGKGLKAAGESYLKGDIAGALKGLTSSIDVMMTGDQKLERARRNKSSLGDVIMFSGCKDDQTSADAKAEDLSFTGALSHALISSMNAKPRQTYVELLQDIRRRLATKYTQLPQLSTGRLMDMNTVFIM